MKTSPFAIGMDEVLMASNGIIVVITKEGHVEKPHKDASGTVRYSKPQLINDILKRKTEQMFIAQEAMGNLCYEE